MEFLDREEMARLKIPILAAAQVLMGARGLRAQADARQWRFFLHCLARTLDPAFSSEFDPLPASAAAQYKFEVESRLRRYYLGFGPAPAFVFVLTHHTQLEAIGYMGEPPPMLAGYCVLVREGAFLTAETGLTGPALSGYLERVVTEGVDAEFRAYQGLPDFDATPLELWFWEDGPAYAAILNILTRHRERNWSLSNLYNPSCKRLMRLRILEIKSTEARVRTQEYWHLYWWNRTLSKYAVSYRETNHQTYVLTRRDDSWKILENQRPAPRTSCPNRRMKSR